MTRTSSVGLSVIILCAAMSFHCSGRTSDPSILGPTPSVTGGGGGTAAGTGVSSVIAAVAGSDGSAGEIKPGTPPAASGGPAVQPSGNTSVVNGGSSQTRVRASAPFQTVYVSVNGVSGYWEYRLRTPTTDATLVLTFGRSIPIRSFDATFAVATPSGAVGSPAAVPTRVLEAATGEVQVSVSWDTPSDVDLHVIDPRGEEIYYARTRSGSGGELDLDSNAGCSIDNRNNENIRWPTGRAPSGTYTVRVDYYSACGVAATNYIVTVNNGGSTQTYRGTFTGAGDFGAAGSGRTIATFAHAGASSTADLSPPPAYSVSPSATALEKLRQAALFRR